MLNLNAIAIAVAVVLPVAAQSWTGCTADEDCLGTPNWRCLQASGTNGSPCVLDYAFNETGYCSCQPQSCVVNTAGQTTTNPQMLVIGDSISLGFFPFLSKLMPNWEIVHAPSFSGSENNDNANWGNRCAHGWLGPNSTSWDAVVINFGLHDLAFEDNEHIDVDTYAILVSGVLGQIRASVKANATLIWNAITPGEFKMGRGDWATRWKMAVMPSCALPWNEFTARIIVLHPWHQLAATSNCTRFGNP